MWTQNIFNVLKSQDTILRLKKCEMPEHKLNTCNTSPLKKCKKKKKGGDIPVDKNYHYFSVSTKALYNEDRGSGLPNMYWFPQLGQQRISGSVMWVKACLKIMFGALSLAVSACSRGGYYVRKYNEC